MVTITLECRPITPEQKKELAENVVPAAAKVLGVANKAVTLIIHENEPENVARGTSLLSEKK